MQHPERLAHPQHFRHQVATLPNLTILEAGARFRAGTLTPTALTRACLERIAARNPALNAFITVLADSALAQAEAATREIAEGHSRGPLHGVPVSLKDILDLEGVPTTAASRVRKSAAAAADAPVTARLRAAGAVIVGKCNLHEFALGTTNEDSAYGPARHPDELARSPGGSSGGSAAAVADGLCLASVGTDTGGSIRIPAAACGIVGLKPGWGEIPADGVVPLSFSLDHVGPMGRTVADAWLMYEVMRGATAPPAFDQHAGCARLAGVRIGVLREYFFDLLEVGVRNRVEAVLGLLRDAGASLRDVQVPHAPLIPQTYVHIVLAEAAAYHAETLDTRGDQYTPPVAERLRMGRTVPAVDYLRAQQERGRLRQEVDAALDAADGIVLPALAITAPRLGAAMIEIGSTTVPVRNVMLRLTQLFNLTGHPAISIPCGHARPPDGDIALPVGLQLVGRRGATSELLRLAMAVESLLTAAAPPSPGADGSGRLGGAGGANAA